MIFLNKNPDKLLGMEMDMKINTNISIYEYITESEIFNKIRDFTYGDPKSNYNKVISQIDNNCNKNICSGTCRFSTQPFYGRLLIKPYLVRQTHAQCKICNTKALSEYDHNACVECANEDQHPLEFNYFHRYC